MRDHALLIIDKQRDFLDPKGYVAQTGEGGILGRVADSADLVRSWAASSPAT